MKKENGFICICKNLNCILNVDKLCEQLGKIYLEKKLRELLKYKSIIN